MVQENLAKLFDALPDKSIMIKDTHSKDYLKDPMGRIDFTCLDGNESLWLHAISVFEVTDDLTDSLKQETAVGQVIQRFVEILTQQPERKFVIGCAAHIQLLWRSKDAEVKKTRVLELGFDGFNEGLSLLLGLAIAEPETLGYMHPVIPHDTGIFEEQGFHLEGIILPAGVGPSTVLSGKYKGRSAVMKIAPDEVLEHEMAVLITLEKCPNVPRILHEFDLRDVGSR